MRDKEFLEGLEILSRHRKAKYIIRSATHNIWVGSTEIPLSIEEFQRMLYIGFDYKSTSDPCDLTKKPGVLDTSTGGVVACYSIYVKNISGEWHVFDYTA